MQMCRIPVDANDQKLDNAYFQDPNRPLEIVWSCGKGWGGG